MKKKSLIAPELYKRTVEEMGRPNMTLNRKPQSIKIAILFKLNIEHRFNKNTSRIFFVVLGFQS